MFKITQDEIGLQKQIDKGKVDLNKTFKKSFNEQEELIKIFVKSINHCDFNSFSDDKVIWNAAGYVNLISLDLKHFARDLALADDEWGKRIYGRMISMLIYESMSDLLELLGKDFRAILKKLSISEELNIELNGISKILNDYKSKNLERLRDIRNVATAHRDKDIMEQINMIESIGWIELIELGTLYDKILNSLGQFLQKVINISVIELKK
ncbi:MAG: hypothetical protein ACYC25_01760 [Paludibacter sp.]